MNKDLLFYQLSLVGKALTAPFYLSKRKISFRPTFVSLETENRCCLRCGHCDLWKKEALGSRMNLAQMKKVILDLKDWLGFFQLNLTGGEPFLNKKIIDLIKFASEKKISVWVNSNGFVIDQKLTAQIVKSGLANLSISLDSLNPRLFNHLRGNQRAWEKAVNSLRMINRSRKPRSLFLSVTCIIMKQNLEELEKLTRWVQKEKLDAIFFQPIWQNFGADYRAEWFKSNQFWPDDYQKVEKAIKGLCRLKKSGYPVGNKISDLKRFMEYFINPIAFGRKFPCLVGVNSFNLDLSGNVRLCFNFDPVGNVLKQKPGEIWNGKLAQQQRLEIASCQRGCQVLLCNTSLEIKETISILMKMIKKIPGKFLR